ncbi:MAG: VOC family protein [Actinomycetales bacterium]
MSQPISVLVYPVEDLETSTAIFTALLGSEPYASAPYYVGFHVGDLEVGLDPNGHRQGQAGPVAYALVDDITAGLAALGQAGAQTVQEPHDVGGGTLVATLKDPAGNVIGLRQNP